MGLLSFLTSAVGGVVLGEVGKWATMGLETFKANQESKRKIAEMQALSTIKLEEGKWEAFRESLKAGDSEYKIPDGLTGVWLGIISAVLLAVHVATKAVRICLVAWAAWFLAHMYALAIGAERDQMTIELMTMCFAVLYWWIGERYQRRTIK